jgi:hypothetical protein
MRRIRDRDELAGHLCAAKTPQPDKLIVRAFSIETPCEIPSRGASVRIGQRACAGGGCRHPCPSNKMSGNLLQQYFRRWRTAELIRSGLHFCQCLLEVREEILGGLKPDAEANDAVIIRGPAGNAAHVISDG